MNPLSSTAFNNDGINLLRKAQTYIGIVAFTTTSDTVVIAVSRDFAQFIPVGMAIGSDDAAPDSPFIDTDVHTYDSTRGVVQATNTNGKYSITISRSTTTPTSGLKIAVLLVACP